jgi:hypothetical protein
MIPSEVKSEHLLKAIEQFSDHPISDSRQAYWHQVYFLGRRYPPKELLRNACVLATGIKPKVNLFGAQEARAALLKLRVPVTDHESIDRPFFHKDELRFFQDRVAAIRYDSSNVIDRNAGEFINFFIWAKTEYWANSVANVLEMKKIGRRSWNQLDKVNGQRFRHYTWYRLVPKGSLNSSIYFTVGVEGRTGELLYKMDCQYEGASALNKNQSSVFETFLSKNGIGKKSERLSDFDEELSHNQRWEELTGNTVEFIHEHLENYHTVVALVNATNSFKHARICWNEEGWKAPSGINGKSWSKDTHERKFGYAHEEWIFQWDFEVDGWMYSRIEPMNRRKAKEFGVRFFTQNAISKKWFWVGEIRKVERVLKEESIFIAQFFEANGFKGRQVGDLSGAENADVSSFEDWPDDDRFNIKFKAEDVEQYTELIPALRRDILSSRYVLVDASKTNESAKKIDTSAVSGVNVGNQNPNSDGSEKSKFERRQKEKLIEIPNLHSQIQLGLLGFLQKQYPNQEIGVEGGKLTASTRVDIVQKLENGNVWFYEVKSYTNVLHSIRVAVGQLLEYALFPTAVDCPDKLIIVTHLKPSESELRYVSTLNDYLSIQVEYLQFDLKTGILME